jgi:PD-(D/E)XK endonuclease
VNPSQWGAIAETALAHEATKLGIVVLKPICEGARYDLVFEMHGQLMRVQCKIGRRKREVVEVRARTCRRNGGGYVRGTYRADEVDAIAVYCPENGRSYLVPITMIPKGGSLYLRLAPSKNNQKRGVNWASQYELGAIAQLGERRYGIPEVAGSSPASSTSRPPAGAALF